MLAAYIVAAIVGGGLILISALAGLGAHADMGGGDFAHDTGLSHDASHDADHGDAGATGSGALWLPFFSLRFWTYAVGTFGLLGTLLTFSRVSQEPLTLTVSSVSALVTGTIAALAVRALSKMERSSTASETDFQGAVGKVTVPIRGSLPGKVRTSVRGDLIDLVAVSHDGAEIAQGEEVIVVEIEGNQARVARQKEFLGE